MRLFSRPNDALEAEKLAGATGFEPAASCVIGRSTNLSEAARANASENWRAKGVPCEETADTGSIVRRKSVTEERSNRTEQRCRLSALLKAFHAIPRKYITTPLR